MITTTTTIIIIIIIIIIITIIFNNYCYYYNYNLFNPFIPSSVQDQISENSEFLFVIYHETNTTLIGNFC